ncbi:MAG: hypothetical protein JW798_10870 [Prolixibacteraceae bacterium]|nr:hypothetical protein [Prolixibacteraceae bacterium]
MKKIQLLISLLSLLFLFSCEEFFNFLKNPDNTNNGDEIRIKSIESYYSDTINISARQVFIYSDNKIDTVILFTKDQYPDSLAEVSRMIYQYNGNTITENTVINNDTKSKTIFETDGDKLLKTTESHKDINSVWQTETIIEYTYEGNKLISQLQHDFDNGVKTKTGEEFYFYDGDILVRRDQYGEWWDSGKSEWEKTYEHVYVYSNSKIDSQLVKYIQADGSYKAISKTAFEYSGDVISKTSFLAWDYSISDWAINLESDYFYDTYGNLLFQYRTQNNGTVSKTAYEWENQNGNIGMLWTFPYQRQIGTSILKSRNLNDHF